MSAPEVTGADQEVLMRTVYGTLWAEGGTFAIPHTVTLQQALNALASHRIAAETASAARVAELEAGIEKFLDMLEHGYAPFVENRLSENMCCNGHMCGCRGASVGEYLAHLLREDTALAHTTPDAPASKENPNGPA